MHHRCFFTFWRFLTTLLLGLCVILFTFVVQASTTVQEKDRTLSQQKEVQKRLHSLQQSLKANEQKRERSMQALQNAEKAISQANRRLRRLKKERQENEQQLQNLRRQLQELSENHGQISTDLSLSYYAQYLNLQKSDWAKFLMGDNPSSLNREQALLNFLIQKQQRTLKQLESSQAKTDKLAQETRQKVLSLQRITAEEQKRQKDLVREKNIREKNLTKLRNTIQSQQANITKLKKDETRLSNLLIDLDKKIQKEASQQMNTPVRLLGLKKKTLIHPTKGKLTATYGEKRGNTIWKGHFYQAKEGTDVIAVANGKVVYADWLRGFGNLIIIDHGKNYMTIYANNESLYKNVGEWVRQGETISSVGKSGGEAHSGLYFELRYQGKPQNPKTWFK